MFLQLPFSGNVVRIWLSNIHLSCLTRFWLCRAVESWLRSSSQFGVADQLFVISRGLLQHIVHVLLESETSSLDPTIGRSNNGPAHPGPPREVAQSSFDLLGEMIRFNMEACRQLDLLLSTEAKVLVALETPFTYILLSFLYRFLSIWK